MQINLINSHIIYRISHYSLISKLFPYARKEKNTKVYAGEYFPENNEINPICVFDIESDVKCIG